MAQHPADHPLPHATHTEEPTGLTVHVPAWAHDESSYGAALDAYQKLKAYIAPLVLAQVCQDLRAYLTTPGREHDDVRLSWEVKAGADYYDADLRLTINADEIFATDDGSPEDRLLQACEGVPMDAEILRALHAWRPFRGTAPVTLADLDAITAELADARLTPYVVAQRATEVRKAPAHTRARPRRRS